MGAMRKAGWMSALKEQDIIPPESWIGTGTPDMPGGEAAMVREAAGAQSTTYRCICL